jgi:hypothetical protein
VHVACHIKRSALVRSQYRNPAVRNMTNKMAHLACMQAPFSHWHHGNLGTARMTTSKHAKQSPMPIKRSSVDDRQTRTGMTYNTEHTARTRHALNMAHKSDYAPNSIIGRTPGISERHS